MFEKMMEERSFPYSELSVPLITVSTFACEIYLKAIILVNGGVATGHKLWELFEKIPEQSKADIRFRYSAGHSDEDKVRFAASQTKFDFDTVIKAYSNSFSRMRYFHEKDGRLYEHGYFGKILLPKYLLSPMEMHLVGLKPDWVNHRNMPAGFELAKLGEFAAANRLSSFSMGFDRKDDAGEG